MLGGFSICQAFLLFPVVLTAARPQMPSLLIALNLRVQGRSQKLASGAGGSAVLSQVHPRASSRARGPAHYADRT